MILELEPQEVQAIINVLGDLPTKAMAFPLMMKIVDQAKAQQPKEKQNEPV
jgi:hypothetical protein